MSDEYNDALRETMAAHGIEAVSETCYSVPGSDGKTRYTVELAGPGGTMNEIMGTPPGVVVLREFRCDCPGYQYRHECKHSRLVANLVADVNDEFGYE